MTAFIPQHFGKLIVLAPLVLQSLRERLEQAVAEGERVEEGEVGAEWEEG